MKYPYKKSFNIDIDDITANEISDGAIQEILKKIAIEEDTKRFEIALNENILDIKDKFTGIHSFMGLKLFLEPLERDISFIIRPTDKLTYEELQKENEKQKELINKIKEICASVPEDWTICGVEKIYEIEEILKEVSE